MKNYIITPVSFLIIVFFFLSLTDFLYAQQDLNTVIKEVQSNSQNFYNSINSIKFSGRSKTYVYFDWPIFSMNMIPLYEDYIFEGYWMKPDSLRINIKAVRVVKADTTKRLRVDVKKPLPNPFQFSYNTSAMGHDSETYSNEKDEEKKMWPVSPFAAGADSIYNFRLLGTIIFSGKHVMVIRVDPKYPDIPAVAGLFMVDPYLKIVVGSDVIFNEAVETRRKTIERKSKNNSKLGLLLTGGLTEDRRVKTKKALWYSTYYLPQMIEEELFATVLGIKVKAYRIIEFDSYILNPEPPDTSVFTNKKLRYVIDPVIEKELIKGLRDPGKLTDEEKQNIAGSAEKVFAAMELSSDLFELETIAKDALKLKLGKKSGSYLQSIQNLSDRVIYNRVEGLRLNYGMSFINPGINNLILSFKGGYGFADARPKGEAAAVYYLGDKKKVFFEAGLFHTTEHKENSKLITTGKNTLTTLFSHSDYRDYYYKKGGSFGIAYHGTDNLAFKLSYISQSEKTAENNIKFSLFKWNKTYRLNPEILEGYYRSIQAKILYRTADIRFDVLAEYSDKDMLRSSFSFTQFNADFNWNYKINKLNSMNFFFSGGISEGAIPPQRWFDFGGKTFVNYFGNLRGIGYKYFTGDRMIYGTVEYTRFLRDMFDPEYANSEDIRLLLKFTFWGGFGWSRLSGKSKNLAAGLNVPSRISGGIYHELGIGVGDRFNLFRLDFVRNSIDKNKILFSINFLR